MAAPNATGEHAPDTLRPTKPVRAEEELEFFPLRFDVEGAVPWEVSKMIEIVLETRLLRSSQSDMQ